ncbi:MAG: Rpn family recombination-promoting nuclease/putative transposase [Bacteroidota bacterium]
MKSNDILWKAILEDFFDDFLRFFVPNADELFDFSKGFEFLDKELEQLFPPDDDNFSPQFVDKLVKVTTFEGNEECVFVHVEVQGYPDKDFALRMFQYYTRIWDKHSRPITAFAIFVDNSKGFHPTEYRTAYLGTEVYYKFNTFKVIEQDDVVLEASNNPFAAVVQTAKFSILNNKKGDQQLFDNGIDLAKRLLRKKMPKQKIRNLMRFLVHYVHFEKHEMFNKFVNEIDSLTERRTTMGIQEFLLDRAEKKGRNEGIEIGVEKGMTEKDLEKNQEFTKSLLKSTDFSPLRIAELVGVSEVFVLKIKKELGL